MKTFLRPPPASRKSPPQFIFKYFPVHILSTESCRLSARYGGYPPPYAQLLHRSPDVTPRVPVMTIRSVFSRRPSVNPEFPAAPPSAQPPPRPRPAQALRYSSSVDHANHIHNSPQPARNAMDPRTGARVPALCPKNTIARFPASVYYRYMTSRQAPKRPGYMNPASRLSAALADGVVAW